ncbi:MAG TPA: FixH family protein [Ktedonobacterales bacterium]|nr:FixH family protein [Ktedonobacterales bacterium]
MSTSTASVTAGTSTHTRRQGYVARGVILGSGLLVLALLAWAHLGLGALVFPPATGPARQVVTAGALRVTLLADSGEMLVGGHNTISLVVDNAAGMAITGANVTVAADMLDMPMPAPTVDAVWAHGKYTAHPVFSMAGPWQLTVTISVPGQSPVHAAFRVGVRWHS